MSKKSHKFDYPHPLIRDLNLTKIYTQHNIHELIKQKPAFYDSNYTFSPSIKTMISPKLLRLTNTKIVPQDKFGILIQPFHANQQVQCQRRNQNDKENWKCKQCKSLLNYQSESVSLYEVKCKICENLQSISLDIKNTLGSVPCCYDICYEDINQVPRYLQKNICFVIQASQFNHNFRVNQVIQSCLSSLKSTIVNDKIIQRKISQVATEDGSELSQNNDSIGQDQKQLTRYNVSFILFNDKNIFVINQSTNDVMVYNESFIEQFEGNKNESVIRFENFFKPIQQVTQQTNQLVSQILYQSYLKNTSCLDITTRFINQWIDKYFIKCNNNNKVSNLNQNCGNNVNKIKRQIQYKYFVNSLKFTKSNLTQSISKQSKHINPQQIFNNVTNLVSSNLTTSKKQNKNDNNKSIQHEEQQINSSKYLIISPNFSFFYLPHYQTSTFHSASQKQVIQKLNHNLYKMYPYTQDQTIQNKNDLFNQLYYDLFHNLTSQSFINVKVKVITSQKIQLLTIGNKLIGYNDCQQDLVKIHSVSQTGMKFNSYQITLNCLQQTSTLPIDFKLLPSSNLKNKKQAQSQTKHYIQIQLQYSKPYFLYDDEPHMTILQRVFHVQVSSLNRAINYNYHIYASLSTYVDDQTLFYFHLRWILAQTHKTKTNHTIFRKLHSEMQKISEKFKDQYGQIDFHKQFIRIFLYPFMIANKPIMNGVNQNFYYDRHRWIVSSMESVSKSLYPRTYQIAKDKQTKQLCLKNIKSKPQRFRSNSLILLDNGKYLYFIIGEDTSVQELKQIFGTCFIHQIRQLTELPELETNGVYRQLIDLARLHHESNYLPLRIIQLFSRQFDDEVSHLLYIQDSHYQYMRELFEMNPIGKKCRS